MRENLAEAKDTLPEYIARAMTIKQRKHISENLKKEDFGQVNFGTVKKILGSSNIHEIRGDIDAF